jgi:hypothetical protein
LCHFGYFTLLCGRLADDGVERKGVLSEENHRLGHLSEGT